MSIALVGSVGAVATGTTSVTPSFAQATTAGNLLICWARCSGVLSAPSGWSQVSLFNGVEIYYKANCAAGETAPTISGGSGDTVSAALAEFSGVATVSPLDQHKATSGASSPVTATNLSADAAPGELLVSINAATLSKSGTHTSSDSYNNGATPTSNLNNDATSTAFHYRFAWGVTTGNSGGDANTGTSDSMNLSSLAIGVASFKVAPVARTISDTGLTISDSLARIFSRQITDQGLLVANYNVDGAPTTTVSLGDASARTRYGIPFTLVGGGNLIDVVVNIGKTGAPGDVFTVALTADSGGQPGTDIVTASLTGGAVPVSPANRVFSLAASLTAGTTYWIVLRRSGGSDASNYYLVSLGSLSTILASRYDNSSWTANDSALWASIDFSGDSISASKSGGGVTLTDTGLTVTDSVAAKSARAVSDTGLSLTDSVISLRARVAADTGLTIAESTAVTRTRAVALSDTGLSLLDSIGALVDRGLMITDAVASLRARPLTDTGVIVTVTVASLRNRTLSDTGLVVTDSTQRSATRPISDTGATVSDSIAAGGGAHFNLVLADRGIGFVPVIFGPLG